jgi:outer membrane receptor protein involved in Fe transport
MIRPLILALSLPLAAAGSALAAETASAPAEGQAIVHRLTPEQMEAEAEAAARTNGRREDRASPLETDSRPRITQHGTIGAGVDSNGGNGIGGTSVTQFGDNATLVISGAREDYGHVKRRWRR